MKEPIDPPEYCAICRGRIRTFHEAAEMHDPKALEIALMLDKEYSDLGPTEAGLVHGECGVSQGWEMS